ncbi:AAA family ATPase [Candidatus Kaiserbacteria bacterium]|nr:AAA family ATPase [Candidatus Kaiserbacteria bacterium]
MDTRKGIIIGITGTLGAGKGTVVDDLVKRHGFKHLSVRDFLNEEIARRGLKSDRDTMVAVGNDLRAMHGSGYITEHLVERALADGGNFVIESIRSIGEAEYLKAHGALLWAVDADIKARYQRITSRASETDAISFEKFTADETREMSNSDPTKQNISAVMAKADVLFRNDGTTEELFAQVEQALASIS